MKSYKIKDTAFKQDGEINKDNLMKTFIVPKEIPKELIREIDLVKRGLINDEQKCTNNLCSWADKTSHNGCGHYEMLCTYACLMATPLEVLRGKRKGK